MRTSCPLTALSYLPADVLNARLNYLTAHNKIDFWGYIQHKGEVITLGVLSTPITDNFLPVPVSGVPRDKDHIHLYFQPSKLIDTNDLSDLSYGLDMIDPSGNPIPLKTTGYRKCRSFEDWYLYNLHYEPYLKTKLEVKEFHYAPTDFVWSDLSVAGMMIDEALSKSNFAKTMRVRSFLDNGGTVEDLAYEGAISPGEAFAYKNFGTLFHSGQWRAGAHIQQVNVDTGEVIPYNPWCIGVPPTID